VLLLREFDPSISHEDLRPYLWVPASETPVTHEIISWGLVSQSGRLNGYFLIRVLPTPSPFTKAKRFSPLPQSTNGHAFRVARILFAHRWLSRSLGVSRFCEQVGR